MSSMGRVKTIPRIVVRSDGRTAFYKGHIRKPSKRKDGYLQIRIKFNNGRVKNRLVHRLVAIAFIPNPDNKPEVNHKDNEPENNTPTNLEWTTTKENIRHAHKNGFVDSARGERHGRAKLNRHLVRFIRDEIAKDQARGKYKRVQEKVRKLGCEITTMTMRSIVIRKIWKHI